MALPSPNLQRKQSKANLEQQQKKSHKIQTCQMKFSMCLCAVVMELGKREQKQKQ